jgi:Ca2+-dependent lipid-binding protein
MPRYQLLVRCENVPVVTRFWQSSYGTYCTFIDKTTQTTLGQTEIVNNTPHPEYVTTFFLETNPSVYHPLQLIVYQDAGIGRDATAIWHAQIEATEVVQSPGHEQIIEMSKTGKIFVRMIEMPSLTTTNWQFQLRALDVQNVEPGWFGLGRSDPYFELCQKSVDPAVGWVRWHLLYRSEIIQDHLNPYWEPFLLQHVTADPLHTIVRIRVYDDNGKHKAPKLIGECETTFEQLSQQLSQRGNADREKAMPLYRNGKTEKTRGWLVVLQANQVE